MNIELTVAIIAGIVALISAYFAYRAQVQAAKTHTETALIQLNAQQFLERQRPFAEAQLKYYIEATETASRIPRTTDAAARGLLVERFWQLYWGALALVEDNEVAGAMIAYGKALGKGAGNSGNLESLSLGIAHACRNSLKRLWVPDLGAISYIRPTP